MGAGASPTFRPRGHSSRITSSSALQTDGESWEDVESGDEEQDPSRSTPGGGPASDVTRGGVLRIREVRRGRGGGPAGSSRALSLAASAGSGASDARPSGGSHSRTQPHPQHKELPALPEPGVALSQGTEQRAATPENSPSLIPPEGPEAPSLRGQGGELPSSSSRIGLRSGARPSSTGGPGEVLVRRSTPASGPYHSDEGAREARQGEQALGHKDAPQQGTGLRSSPGLQELGPERGPRASAGSSDSDVIPVTSHRAQALPLEAHSLASAPPTMGAAPPPLPQQLLRLSPSRAAGPGRWPGLGGLMDTGSVLQQAHGALPIRGLAAVRPGSLPMASLTQRREEARGGWWKHRRAREGRMGRGQGASAPGCKGEGRRGPA